MWQGVFETQPKIIAFDERLESLKTRKMPPRDVLIFLVVI
jgi:hypothetical protein